MKLNSGSYVHKKIRQLCYQMELLTGMHLLTNLSEEFDEIRFIYDYGYIIVNWERKTCFTLGYQMNDKVWETIKDLMTYLGWLETGKYFEKITNTTNYLQIKEKYLQPKKDRVKCKHKYMSNDSKG